MSEQLFDANRYSVGYAAKEIIGEEWNSVVWDRNHHQIQYHRLYLLSDGSATLHLYDKTVELLPHNIYFIPAFSIVQSEIKGEMNKYYIHFWQTPRYSGFTVIFPTDIRFQPTV